MSFRRFVNLVANDGIAGTFNLRRIDMSRFFWPAATKIGNGKQQPVGNNKPDPSPPPIEDGSLPEPDMTFCPPERDGNYGQIEFMLVKDKVVATDCMGNASMYNPDLHAVRMLPSLRFPKKRPISIAIRDALYVLDGIPRDKYWRSFDALMYETPCPWEEGNWLWCTLPSPPPPPFLRGNVDPTRIDSCAVVDGSHIWVSTRGGGGGSSYDSGGYCCTFSFNTETLMWSKPVDWALPFRGPVEYLPEHKLWFGISSRDTGHVFSASNLAGTTVNKGSVPPALKPFKSSMVVEEEDWHLVKAHAVHLGCSKFCVARFFSTSTTHIHEHNHLIRNDKEEYFVVFSGVEVNKSSDDNGGELHAVEHKSERYMLGHGDAHWVLRITKQPCSGSCFYLFLSPY